MEYELTYEMIKNLLSKPITFSFTFREIEEMLDEELNKDLAEIDMDFAENCLDMMEQIIAKEFTN